jgi:hypothetical protein
MVIACCFFSLNAFAQLPDEHFSFDLKFGFLKGGEATFTARNTLINDTAKIRVQLHAYTTGFAQMLYGVDDRFESTMCAESLLPNYSSKNLREQNYRFNNKVYFNHSEQRVYSERSGWYNVEEGICDVSSMIYNLRHSGKIENLRKGQIVEVPFWDTDEWYMLRMQYTGNEIVKTALGRFECLRFEPLSVSGRFFNKKNPMNVWITNDSRRLPVLMELNFTIGSVRCELNKT